jgi:hypothetical protein
MLARPEQLTLADMLERFVHVATGPQIVDMSNVYQRWRPCEFEAAYAHCIEVADKRAVPLTTKWRQSPDRMVAHAMTFHPGKEQFFRDERGVTHLNIWQEPTWPQVDPKLAAPFFEHLEYLLPDEVQREAFIEWLAHAVQHSEVRPHYHFLLLAPTEGTGRGWVYEVCRRLWSDRHVGDIDLHRLMDENFNSELSGKIIMAVQEVRAPAEERYQNRERLKSMLTDSEIRINEKHLPKWRERFCVRFMMFTNRQDALPLWEGDRRVYVVRCADQPREKAYYRKLYARLEDQAFLAALWHRLRTWDLSGFDPGRRAPLNEVKRAMIAANRSEEQQSAVEFVQACPYDLVAAADLMRLFVPVQLDDNGRPTEPERDRKARTNAITAALREIGCQTWQGTRHGKIKLGTASTRVWILRDPGKWSLASAATVSPVARDAHKAIEECGYLPDACVSEWSGDEE